MSVPGSPSGREAGVAQIASQLSDFASIQETSISQLTPDLLDKAYDVAVRGTIDSCRMPNLPGCTPRLFRKVQKVGEAVVELGGGLLFRFEAYGQSGRRDMAVFVPVYEVDFPIQACWPFEAGEAEEVARAVSGVGALCNFASLDVAPDFSRLVEEHEPLTVAMQQP